MIELHLAGYTADLGHLVLDLAGADGGRYRLVVDEDLFATLDELREQRRAASLPVGDLVEYAEELGLGLDRLERLEADEAAAAAAVGHVSTGSAAGAELLADALASSPDDAPDEDARWASDGGLVARLLDERAEPESEPEPEPPPPIAVPPRHDAGVERQPPRPPTVETARAPRPVTPTVTPTDEAREPTPRAEATLSPAEIQARLRQGRSVRTVAREAGVDDAWIRRWEAPILAEQARVRDHALALRLHRPRLGSSSLPLGTAVAHNLAAMRVADDDVAWDVSRRRDGRWRVTVRYVVRGRKRSATWTWDPQEEALVAASDNARELGFVRRHR